MNDLEMLLEPLIESAPEPPPAAAVRERAARVRRRRRARSGGLAVMVVAALVGGIAIAVPRNRHEVRTIAPSNTATAPPRVHMGTPRRIPTGLMDMTAAYGSMWISRPDQVLRLDGTDGHVIATIDVPGESDFRNLTAGAGSIWVDDTGTGNLTRIDAATNRVVATMHLTRGEFVPDGVAFLDGFVWVARLEPMGTRGDVVAIDPATNRIAHQAAIPRSFNLRAGSDALWFVADSRGGLERLDPHTLRTTIVRSDVSSIVGVSRGRLWLQTQRGVVEVDERTGAAIGSTIRSVGPVNVAVVAVDGIVWVASQPGSSAAGSATPYDARTHRVIGASTKLGLPILGLEVTPGALWAAVYDRSGLTRIPYSRR